MHWIDPVAELHGVAVVELALHRAGRQVGVFRSPMAAGAPMLPVISV